MEMDICLIFILADVWDLFEQSGVAVTAATEELSFLIITTVTFEIKSA